MATAEEIYEAFVTFTVRGVETVNQAADAVSKKMDSFASGVEKATLGAVTFGAKLANALRTPGNLLIAMGSKIRGLASALSSSGIMTIAKTLSFSGALGIGGIFAAASRGTIEMQNLSLSFQRFADQVGAGFAPIVRGVTTVLQELTNIWKALNPELKESIFNWALLGTAIAGAVTLLPTALRIIGGIATVVGYAANAVIGLTAGIYGLATAIGGVLISSLTRLAALAAAHPIISLITLLATGGTAAWIYFNKGTDEAISKLERVALAAGKTRKEFQELQKDLDNPNGAWKRMLPIGNQAAKPGGGMGAAPPAAGAGGLGALFDRLKEAFNKGFKDKSPFTRGTAAFEGIPDTWTRLQLGVAQDKANIEQAQLKAIEEGNADRQKLMADIAKIAAKPAAIGN